MQNLSGHKMCTDYKNIVWDWNGTILDDIDAVMIALNTMLVKRGLKEISTDKYRATFRFPVVDFYLDLGFDLERESIHDISVEYQDLYNGNESMWKLTDGVLDVLNHFKNCGRKQYIVSALVEENLIQQVARFKLNSYFIGLYGSENIYGMKKIDTGRRMLDDTSVVPSETLMIGDTEHDAEVADVLQFDCVLYTQGHNKKSRLSAFDTIDNMKDLV